MQGTGAADPILEEKPQKRAKHVCVADYDMFGEKYVTGHP
jgi:hypothetical protein